MPRRTRALALSIPPEVPLESIASAELAQLVDVHLTRPLLELRELVGTLRGGDTLAIEPAPPPRALDGPGFVLHHAQAMMIETLRVELGLQGIAVDSTARKPSLAVPALGRREPGRNPWTGRAVLVTGASSGLGQAAAHELAGRGAVVHGVARRRMRPASFPGGGRFVPCSADVTRYEELLAGLEAERFFAIVHAAGTGSLDLIQHANPDNLRQDMATNVLGTFNLAKLARARLAPDGHFAVVTSGAARVPWAGGVSYVTAKAAQHAIAVQAARGLRRRNAAVTAVLAGAFNSGAWVTGLRYALLQEIVRVSAHLLPRPARVARQMLADVERGDPISTAGLIGGFAYTCGEAMHLWSKSTARALTALRLGLPLRWLGRLSA